MLFLRPFLKDIIFPFSFTPSPRVSCSIPRHLFICAYACLCFCGGHTYVCVHACLCECMWRPETDFGCLLLLLSNLVCEADSSLSVMFRLSARLTDQKAPGICLFPYLSPGVARACCHTQLSWRYCLSRLSSSRLCKKLLPLNFLQPHPWTVLSNNSIITTVLTTFPFGHPWICLSNNPIITTVLTTFHFAFFFQLLISSISQRV